MRDLNATLASAQTAVIRQPIMELKSIQSASAIPFTGQPFTMSKNPETAPVLMTHSSGDLLTIFVRDYSIRLMRSSDNGTTWSETEVTGYYSIQAGVFEFLSAAELANGSIGIVYSFYYGTTQYIYYLIFDIAGTVLHARTQIFTFAMADYILRGLGVTKADNGTYVFVYTYEDVAGGTYVLAKRTSSDFLTWSGESAVPTGLSSGYPLYSVSIKQLSATSDILLFISIADNTNGSSEKVNLYFSASSDNGSTWGAFSKISGIPNYGSGIFEPACADKDENYALLAYTKKDSALIIDTTSALYSATCTHAIGYRVFYNSDRNRLYSVNIGADFAAPKVVCSVTVIDTTQWAIVRSYSIDTTPAIPNIFNTLANNSSYQYAAHSRGSYISYCVDNHVFLINDLEETLIHYVLDDDGSGYSVNVAGYDTRGLGPNFASAAITYISDDDKLWVLTPSIVATYFLMIGYFDLTEEPSGGVYQFHEVVYDEIDFIIHRNYTMPDMSTLIVDNTDGLIIASVATDSGYLGFTTVYDLSSGNRSHTFSYNSDVGYPYHGIRFAAYKNGIIWGDIYYESAYNQENYRGIARIDISSGVVTYKQPTYETKDEYRLGYKIITNDNILLMAGIDDGMVSYNITTNTWTQYSKATAPDIFGGGLEQTCVTSIAFNEEDKLIYLGCPDLYYYSNLYGNIKSFSLGGPIKEILYRELVKSGTWSASGEALLITGSKETYPGITYDASDSHTLWASWEHTDAVTDEKSIYYADAETELDLTDYIIDGRVSVSKDVASPGSLSFALKQGHMFDQGNIASSYRRYLKKGRAVTLRLGQKIGGLEYWTNQGTFYIDTVKLTYQRGKYPSMSVTCTDILGLLDRAAVVASEDYANQYPEAIISDLLQQYGYLDASEIDLGSFDTRHRVYYQVVDDEMLPAIKSLTDHFGVFLYADFDNLMRARSVKVVFDAADLTISDSSNLRAYTPDDNFSDYTNRVTVTGEGLTPVEVIYDEEMLTTLAGTGGWWKDGSDVLQAWYSTDHQTKARNPRLVIKESISDFEILWQESNGTEYLSTEDPNGYYVEITIEWPGLMWILIGLIAAVVALGAAALFCDESFSCGGFLMAFSLLMSAVSYLLGQVANYNYEIWARPFGEEKQQFQASANDLELQEELNGKIIEQTIDDPFCYTEASCQRVADYELGVVQAQRRRVSFERMADLRLEVGDVVTMPHPYSGTELRVFITKIEREFGRATVSKKAGTFVDKIQGWRL